MAKSILVSIHAPAKGATRKYFIRCEQAVLVSIHAPAKGATWPQPMWSIRR